MAERESAEEHGSGVDNPKSTGIWAVIGGWAEAASSDATSNHEYA